MRLIDADTLHPENHGLHGSDLNRAVEMIELAPTIIATPVIHAYWEPYDKLLTVDRLDGPVVEEHTFYRCSHCKKGCFHRYSGTTYCPECGAKMEGV